MAAGDMTLNVGHLTGLSGLIREANDTVPQNRPGTVSLVVDAFGFGIFKYIRAIAALTKGQLAQMTGTGTTPIQTFTNTGTVATGWSVAGMTANDHQGKIAYVLDDAGGAGALPEGEVSIVSSNTTTQGFFEPDMPLSTALANNDTVTVVATYQAEVGTAGTFGQHCQGLCVANGGISAGSYGWVKQYGMSQYVNVGTPTTTAVSNLVAATTGALDIASTNTYGAADLTVATSYTVTTDDQATPRGLCKVVIFALTTVDAT